MRCLYCAFGEPDENHAGHHESHDFVESNTDVEGGADEGPHFDQIDNDSDDDSDYEDAGEEVLSSDGEIDEYSDDSDGEHLDDGGSDDPDESEVHIKPTSDNRLLFCLMLLAWQSEHFISFWFIFDLIDVFQFQLWLQLFKTDFVGKYNITNGAVSALLVILTTFLKHLFSTCSSFLEFGQELFAIPTSYYSLRQVISEEEEKFVDIGSACKSCDAVHS